MKMGGSNHTIADGDAPDAAAFPSRRCAGVQALQRLPLGDSFGGGGLPSLWHPTGRNSVRGLSIVLSSWSHAGAGAEPQSAAGVGLTARHEELPWEKVARFSHRSGLFWDAIAIETRGQTAATISCLSKRNAAKLKKLLHWLSA